LDEFEGEICIQIFQKFNNVLDKNNGYNTILRISKILTGPERLKVGLPDDC